MFLQGFHYLSFDSITSTNNYVLENMERLEHHTVVVSEIQTTGRGRRERTWDSSTRGNLYMSLLEKQFHQGSFVQNFTQLMAVSVVAACRHFGVSAGIKWPNDIFVENKKLGGILSEGHFSGHKCRGLVIGIGINIVAAPHWEEKGLSSDYEAIAFNDCGPHQTDRDSLLSCILTIYMKYRPAFLKSGYSSIANEYENLLLYTDREFCLDGKTYQFAGINNMGQMRGRHSSGEVISIQNSDVQWDFSKTPTDE